MAISTDLHLYLTKAPPESEIRKLLTIYGFKFVKEYAETNDEPKSLHFMWKAEGLSEYGFSMAYYLSLCEDDLYHGNYGAFAIISGRQESSALDLNMVDITAYLLTSRYGGVIHNPNHTDKISANVYLSAK